MAKIQNVIRHVDAVKPNAFGDEVKVQWLNEAEGYIQTDVMMLALADVVQYDPEQHMDAELLVKPPHDKLYAVYLMAMVDFANGEYDKYNNTMQLYNEFVNEYIGWYILHFRPADGKCVKEGYYLSAYSIALLHGYEGTEEEWLESLNGMTAYDDAVLHGYSGTREDFGRDQAMFAANAEAVRLMRDQTIASQTAAKTSETNAARSEKNAASSESSAKESARVAKLDADRADSAYEGALIASREAVNAAANALAARESVDKAEERVDTLTSETKVAAQAAQKSASEAKTSETNAKISETNAERAAEAAAESENAAESAASEAVESAGAAETAANRAEEAADRSVNGGAYIVMSVGEDGNLYMEKSENADGIDLSIDKDGNLIMEVAVDG